MAIFRYKLVPTIIIIVVMGVALLARATPPTPDVRYRPGELLIKLAPGLQLSPQAHPLGPPVDELAMLLTQAGAYYAKLIAPGSQTYHVFVASTVDIPTLAEHIAASAMVVYAEPNSIRHIQRTPNDEHIGQQWALETIHAFDAWDITTGSDIVVAVVDTGVTTNHPDLEGKILPGYNALLENSASADNNGHGTAIAGLIAARTNNQMGVAGVCWGCMILPVKVLNDQGAGDDATLARGIRWATDHGAHIINLSLGGAENSQALRDAVEYAYQQGVLLIAASGNEQRLGNFTNYPAAYPQVVAVGATTNADKLAGFSNTGEHIDLVAPGVALWTTTLDGSFGPPNGTSFSSPFVSGVAALVKSIRPDLSHADVACILKASADDLGPVGKDTEYGWGRLHARRALEMAQTYTGCSLPTSPAPTEQEPAPKPISDAIAQAFLPIAPDDERVQVGAYFPETRHTLRGEFLHYWQVHGGLPVFGYPISEEFIEPASAERSGGHTFVVQYFERYRFEFRPEHPAPYNVLLSRMGDDILTLHGQNWLSFPKQVPQMGCLYFEGTEQNVCGTFLHYWQQHGLELDGQVGKSFGESLALFGQPLSGVQGEEVAPGVTVPVQWFERARFEDHGEKGVLLGRLGNEFAIQQQWIQP
jgi:type VII secretion-associated serine protease mycosin